MASISIISPKAFFIRIADVFQKGITTAPPLPKFVEKTEREVFATPSPSKKMNITLHDLKTISTALLHYRRSLARLGEEDRAESVAQIDKKFYELINQLEVNLSSQNSQAA
jgi:hypothetical protein